MAKRTGAPTIRKTALRLCRLLGKFSAGLVVLYPDNTALIAALAAAQIACNELSVQIFAILPVGD